MLHQRGELCRGEQAVTHAGSPTVQAKQRAESFERIHRGTAPTPMTPETSSAPVIERLVGVYNANGTLRGELAYWIGARLGRAHCALCDITHGTVRERPDWQVCRDGLPVPFDTYHVDDQPLGVREVLNDCAPAVVAQTDHGLVVLLGADELEACEGSPDRLTEAISAAADAAGMRWAG